MLMLDSENFKPSSLNPIYQHFICKICDSIIFEGKQCSNRSCSVLYCGPCVKDKIRSWRCNECGDGKAPLELHKRVRDMVELLRLICPGCNEEMMYKQMFEHIKNCDGVIEISKNGRTGEDEAKAASESQVVMASQNRR